MRIGVLALQGAFIEHRYKLLELGVESFEIRNLSDLQKSFEALIIPGGESTVIGKLLNDLEMLEPLKQIINKDKTPVFGTCAGMILLANKIEGSPKSYFSSIDIEVRRNAYGRQLSSFFTKAQFKGIGEIPMSFIRAPFITKVGEEVEILSIVDGNAVAARQNNVMVTSYHPEITDSNLVHKYFIDNFI